MAKYHKKPIVVEAELFEMGMEDGYAFYSMNGTFYGFCSIGEPHPKANKKPAIKTLEGWYEVKVGEHYIVTGITGERYPVEKWIFEKMYEVI